MRWMRVAASTSPKRYPSTMFSISTSATPPEAAVGEEDLGRGGPARQARLRARQRVRNVVLDRNAVARQRDRRRDQLGEREFARAVFRVREREPRDRAGDADGERGVLRFARIGVAPLVEEDVARGGRRRGLAIVDGGGGLAAGEVDHHVAAAADIAGARIGHSQREAGRDRGVDGVAALLEHLDADARGAPFLRDHHALARRDRLDARGGYGCGIDDRGRLRRERPEAGQACEEREQRVARHAYHRALQGGYFRT